MSNYSTFAKMYQNLFDNDLYKRWLDFVVQRSKSGKTLDIGGGNGELALMLAQENYQVTILDLSIEMLELAKEKIEENKFEIELVNADMTDFRLQEKFKIITSFADTINYLDDEKKVAKLFRNVFNHLDGEGVFLFDVITPHMANITYDQYMFNDDSNEDNIFMWTVFEGDQKNSIDHDLKFFVYDENIDAYKIIREVHHEQTYEIEILIKLLKESGFNEIKTSSDFGEQKIDSNTDRVFFEVRK